MICFKTTKAKPVGFYRFAKQNLLTLHTRARPGLAVTKLSKKNTEIKILSFVVTFSLTYGS